MSRYIKTSSSYEKSPFEKREGRLVITEYREKQVAMYIADQRIYGAMVLPKEEDDRNGNIYVGRVSGVVKSSKTCFVEYKKGCVGFLPLKGKEHLKEGDILPVMLEKEPIKTKPATLTANISLEGEYFVFSKEQPGLFFSKKLSSEVKERIREVFLGQGCDFSLYGVVVRTNAAILTEDYFLEVFHKQRTDFEDILRKASFSTAFQCIYRNTDPWKMLQTAFKKDEALNVVSDSPEMINCLKTSLNKPQGVENISLYEDQSFSLIHLYRVDTLMTEALQKSVWLKNGGNIVIEQLETLTAIDVNAAKGFSMKEKNDGESVQLRWNKEAAREIALQMRLRNLTGMILVDFINMDSKTEEKILLDYMKNLCKEDIQEVSVLDITALGLMEITRKKGTKSLREQFY